MLMDIETGRENKPKQEKPNKPKKTNYQKSIIAGNVILCTMIAYFIASTPLLVASNKYRNDLINFENEKEKVYEEFMKSEEFTESFKQDVIKLSEEYLNRKISYDQYAEKLEYLKTVANAQVVLHNSDSELNNIITEIDRKIEARKRKFEDSPQGEIATGLAATAATVVLGSAISYAVYSTKDAIEERKNKTQQNQDKGLTK